MAEIWRIFAVLLWLVHLPSSSSFFRNDMQLRLQKYRPTQVGIASQRGDDLFLRLGDLCSSGGVIIIDGDNVRGKTKFSVTKERLCDDLKLLIGHLKLQGRVAIVFDHASRHQAFYQSDSGLSIIFSGPRKSADDIISRDVRWIQEKLHRDVVVITEDQLLRKRCREVSSSSRLGKKRQQKLTGAVSKKESKKLKRQQGKERGMMARLKTLQAEDSLLNAVEFSIDVGMPTVSTSAASNQAETATAVAAVAATQFHAISSALFVEMLYGTPSSSSHLTNLSYSPVTGLNSAMHSSGNKKNDEDDLIVTTISDAELRAIKPLLSSAYAARHLKAHPTHHRPSHSPQASTIATTASTNTNTTVSVALEAAAAESIAADKNFVDLMRKEVSFRRQIDHLKCKISSGKVTRKAAENLQQRLELLTSRLNMTLVAASELRTCLAAEGNRFVAASKTQRKKELMKPVGKLINKAIRESAQSVLMSETTTSESETAEGIDLTTSVNADVVIRGTEIIRRLLREVRGARQQAEETWERVILAERMRSSLEMFQQYSHIIDTVNTAAATSSKSSTCTSGVTSTGSGTGDSASTDTGDISSIYDTDDISCDSGSSNMASAVTREFDSDSIHTLDMDSSSASTRSSGSAVDLTNGSSLLDEEKEVLRKYVDYINADYCQRELPTNIPSPASSALAA